MKQILLVITSICLIACSVPENKINLEGTWGIRLDKDNLGVKEKWFDTRFTETVELPGSLQEQGYGDNIDVNTKWTGDLNDKSWFTAPEYEKYRQEGNIKFPYWLNPDKHYVGIAWYQKEISIPGKWKNKPVILELERPHWGTTLYVDGVEIENQDAMSTPHRYVLEGINPGKHIITLRVDNNVIIPVGVNAHSVSDHTQSNWNGIVGNISLAAKPCIYIEDVQIYPDIANKKVIVNTQVIGKKNIEANLSLQIEKLNGDIIGEPVKLITKDENIITEIEAGETISLWSEFSPNLYRLRTTLISGNEKDERVTNFGFRDFKKDGTRFTVNGNPIFLRGTLECCIFPLTGYPAMESSYWEKIYRTCKEFGLNHVRFHSWCPPEVAFSIADSMGIYLQVECAAWAGVGDNGPQDKWFYAEGDRILKEYGNHPSFCMMAYGNEPGGKNQVTYLTDLVAYWKEKDNRRVYTSAAGWPYVENADYWNAPDPRIQGWGQGLKSIINGQPPRTDYDFANIIRKNMPTVSHEIGQWCVYPNFKEIDKYTGVLKAKNFEIFKETLDAKHMGDLADDFLYASGRLQTLCYKADIEAALRTPGFAGFQLLDLHDFPGQGTALVGVLDAFWDTKGYVGGKEYSQFNNHTVPLVRFPKMIWLNNEHLNVPVEFAHFGETPLNNTAITWTAITADNQFIGKGSFTKDLPVDNCIPVGNIDISLEQLKKPTQVAITVQIEGTPILNKWNIWVYPAEKKKIDNAPAIVTNLNENIIDRLHKGENILFIPPRGSIHPDKGGKVAVGFSPIFWNTAWTNKQPPHTLGILCDASHPALSSFPNEGVSDYQWWDIVANCDAMIMDDFPADYRPVIHLIDDWVTNRKLGILFETKVGKGKLMVCSVDLQKDIDKRPAAAQFKHSILDYMASDRFNPQQEIDLELIRGLVQN